MRDRQHDTETESYREEQGKPADASAAAPGPSGLTLGGMIRGPVGREGARDDAAAGGETSAEADERVAREGHGEGES